jgi:hypothetical protein
MESCPSVAFGRGSFHKDKFGARPRPQTDSLRYRPELFPVTLGLCWRELEVIHS